MDNAVAAAHLPGIIHAHRRGGCGRCRVVLVGADGTNSLKFACMASTFGTSGAGRWLAAALVLATSLPAPLFAQAPPGPAIQSIDFVGLNRTTPSFALGITRLNVGDPFSRDAADEAVTRLLRTRRYLSATYRTMEVADGVRLTFELLERATITAIRFEGNRRFRDGQLREAIGLKVDDPADGFALRDGRDAIIAKYKEVGYADVKVSFDQDLVDRTGELFFRIDEGGRVKVSDIAFPGNNTFARRELMKQIETRTAIWIFRTGAYDAEQVENDASKLQNFFRDQGYLDARVGFRAEESPDGQQIRVEFLIEEGTRYLIEDIRLRGHAVFSTDELLARLKSRVGGIVKQPDLDADAKQIQAQYGEIGYIYASVRPQRVFSDRPGFVIVTFEITERDQFRVGRVVVRGNPQTRDKVVRRALNLYPPDDLWNLTEAREAERRLVETRIFSSARVTPVGDEPGVRDVVMDVVEAEKLGDLLFGVGITSNSGVVGSIILDLKNFDIFDTPRSWSEFFRFKSFTGAGQRFRMELAPGTEVTRISADFTEPYLFDRPLRFDTGVYYFERGRDGYDETRFGGTVALGKRFERGRIRGWSGEVALRTEIVRIDDTDFFSSDQIREDEGDNFMTSLKGSLVRDRTDNRLIPSSGDRFRVAYEQFGALGGDHIFGRVTAGYSWYRTLWIDARERKHIFQLRTEGGWIVGDAPVFERFYAGGTGSIRGFAFRGIGPRDGLDDNNVGGDYLLLAGGEYSFPVYEDMLRGMIFLDSGQAGSGTWRASAGVGIRLTLNIFGPIPIELSVAYPFSRDDDDEEQIFNFTVGSVF